jgi:dTDP-glucose pyrophosphorylase
MVDNWKNILVTPLATIQDVLKVIDREGLQLALVVDNENYLQGTVTDGDIRRALINDIPLSASVAEIMFKQPTTVGSDVSKHEIFKILNDKELMSIPVLDQGKVIGLETLHKVIDKKEFENPVFLMAGGFGSRLSPLTDECPKPLLTVGDKPILEIVLLRFIQAGFKRFYISTHYLPGMIQNYFGNGEKWNVSISYVHEGSPLGTGGALGLLPANMPDLPIILMNGDVLTKINLEDLLAFHNNNNASATMCVREYEYQVPYGVIEGDGYLIKSMVEKPVKRFHVNAGIYVIGREIIESVGINEVIDMPSLLERHLDTNVLMYSFHEYWLDIGRMDDYRRAQTDIRQLNLS